MPGPLAALRVVDCSSGTAGPRATGLLADYGADVIWVEPPRGDPHRAELAVPYSVFNRGKRSIELDLRDVADRDLLIDLVGTADVFVESWQPGVADDLGLAYQMINRRASGVVYCSISGFGRDGPDRDTPGYEALVHAIVGTMGVQAGHRDKPIFEALPFASIGAAYLAVIGILSALYRRHDDGLGRHVDTSLLDGALAYLTMGWSDTDHGEIPLNAGSYRLVSATFLCGDNEYIGVHTGAVGAFGRLMQLLGLDDRIPPSESGLDIGVPLPAEQKEYLDSRIHEIFASAPRATWMDRLLEADICAMPLLQPCEIFDEAQPRHNGMVARVDDPLLGPLEQVAPAAKLSVTPAEVRSAAPEIGAHTAEIRAEIGAAARPSPTAEPGPADDRPLLDGVKILDFGAYFAGPYASRLLADFGADVIKLEPVVGDQLRGMARVFRPAQAGKRSIAVNLKDPELRTVAHKLAEWADVASHNMRPGAAERLGLGYDQIRARNPNVVYAYAPGWGSSGPDMNRQSFAPLMSGYVGSGFEVAGQLNPPLFPAGHEDPGAGLAAAVGMLMALLHRRRTGEGQVVEVPQLNGTMAHMSHIVRRTDGTVLGAGMLDPVQLGYGALCRLYETSDGWICIVATQDNHVDALGHALELDLLGDERFASSDSRAANDVALANILTSAFACRTTADVRGALSAAGVPAAVPALNHATEFVNDPENRRTGRIAECANAEVGHVREVAQMIRVSDAKVPPHRLAPGLGEHTDEILAWLGYAPETIDALRARGAAR